MPTAAANSARPVAPTQLATSYGQVIEYIQDRLYLASYTHAPNEKTPFPYPLRQQSRSPTKRSARSQTGPTPSQEKPKPNPVYFSIDKSLLYNAFHADFGPLHIGHLYRFAVVFHEVLGDPNNEDRPVVFWSNADSRSRANAACVLACYMVLIQNWPPHLALAPIAQMDPPCMPFRDAGYSQADYTIAIQDVIYGIWRAKEEGLCALKDFSLEEYERYERVDQGDFNWITPHFLAFASPQHEPVKSITPSHPDYSKLPTTIEEVRRAESLPTPFKNVLTHFASRNIGLVVRLNSELYCSSYFAALGITHKDMIFDDGTCPPLHMVRTFIALAHETINSKKRGIAVHCKAGLGRTGCLIGAYLIYRHGFTANEIIAYMRFMRPGMVVGPQQHWLHLNQGTFREWWYEDTVLKPKLAELQPSTPTRLSGRRLASTSQTFTPPNGSQKRAALGEITSVNSDARSSQATWDMDIDSADPKTASRYHNYTSNENLPAPTPGQPRKTSKAYGMRSSSRALEDFAICADAEVVTTETARHTRDDEGESEEEYQLRMLARRSASRSPGSKRRAVSCTTTTVTTWGYPGESDVENYEGGVAEKRAKSPGRVASGKGDLSVGKARSPTRRSGEAKSGVRKTSGRVGSMGRAANAGAKAE